MSRKKAEEYTQCAFNRGDTNYVAWIPKEFAVKGKYVKLKKDGTWEDGWKVIAVFNTISATEAMFASQKHKKHRKHSDI